MEAMLKTPRSLGQKRLEVLCGAKRMKQHEKNLRSLEMASPMTRGHQEDPRRSKKFKMNAPADKKSPEPKSPKYAGPWCGFKARNVRLFRALP